jgi:cell division inhibitor SepF
MSSMFAKIGSWFAIHDEELDEVEGYEPDQAAPKRNVVPLTEAGRRVGPSVAVFAPRGFSDVTEIADALRSRQVAIVNLQGADRTLLQRVVDFTSGVAYTIDGRIQKLAESIYLVVPAGVNVNSANLREQMNDDGMLDLSARYGNNTRNER